MKRKLEIREQLEMGHAERRVRERWRRRRGERERVVTDRRRNLGAYPVKVGHAIEDVKKLLVRCTLISYMEPLFSNFGYVRK